jgi:TolB-like protein/Tfp pilus assembly protein PilF
MFGPSYRALPRRPRTLDFQERLQTTLGTAYRLERELGGGGMSRTFVAAETSLGRRVVVKVLPPDLAASVSSERFRKEILLAASLQHPHIVSVLAAGQGNDLLYYTMPLIEGVTLRTRLQQSGELPIGDALSVLRDVARALAYAHRRGVVHRDIKPENILLSEDGAMVADFGVAKALSASTSGDSTRAVTTGIGVALGTPAYMSPEQAAADPHTDHRSDIYSLGMVAYELLAGFSPFAGRPMTAIFVAHATEIPEPIEKRRVGVPARLAALITKCLQKRPADRPQTAEAVLQELDAVAQELSAPQIVARRPWWRQWRSQLALAGLLIALAGGWAYYKARAATAFGSSTTRRHTIAVLPFANIGESKADESFSDGITEELIGAFGKIDELRVKSAFSLKGSQQDVRDLGRQLDVESVVAGSVRRSGDVVRISARLVNVADGFQLWTDTYERELRNTADVFGIQDEITKAIVNALKLKLSLSGDAIGQASRQTANLDAYRAVLNGRYFMAKRTPEGIRTAITFFEDAVAKDPKYAVAWDGLAESNALLNTYAFVSPEEVFGRAREAVSKALALDSTLAEGYATSAYIGLNNTWDWPAVERAFKRSIALNPNYATAHHWFSLYLDAMGRGPDALKEVQRALELDPVSLIINREAGRTYYYMGDNEHALQAYRRTLELDPTFRSAHVWIARAYIAQGRFAAAIDELRDQPDYQGGHSFAVLAYAYAKAGQRDRAAAILEELRARAKRENVWPMYLGLINLALGNRGAALGMIESDYEHRSAQMAYIAVDPLFAELRSADRFRRILEKMKLPM